MDKTSQNNEQKTQKFFTPASFLTGSLSHIWIVFLFLPLLAVLIYSNTFSASFHFDDTPNIVDNPRIRHLSFLLLSEHRYVGFLSFALNYHFGKLNVFGYHLVNLLIHITNGFLVYTLILLLFKTPRMQSSSFDPNRSFWIALATALLFVAHPIQTQAVTYIVQRLASLATLFYLLAVVLYLKWRLAPSEARSRSLWNAGALLSTVLAMKTKEITFTLPFMLLLVEAIFFGFSTRKQWIALIPFLLTLPIIPLSHSGAIGEGEGFAKETTAISRLDYLFTQFRIILTYLRLLIFPVYQNLDYDYPISHSLLEPKVLFSFLFLSGLFGLALYLLFLWPRFSHSSRFSGAASPLVAFGILWFFLTLSIESSIIPIRDVIFEHRLYLPSVGFFLAVSVAVSSLLHRWLEMSAVVIGGLVIIFSVATYQRNLIWKDELTLWGDVIQKSPNKARAHNNLGVAYKNLGRYYEAIREYKTGLIIDPNSAMAHYDLGNVYKDLGRLDEAIQEYKTALSIIPNSAEGHNNLGEAYQGLGHLDEAIREYKTALTINPISAEAHNNLGVAYKNLGRLDEAIREYKTVLNIIPNSAVVHNNLGTVYLNLGRMEDAIQEYQITLKLKPDLVEAHYNLGQTYQHTGRIQEATHEFEQALQIKPNYDLARQALKSLRP